MKRQYVKTPLVVTGIFCTTLLAVLTAVFFQADFTKPEPERQAVRTVNVQPLPGHWLKTAGDEWYRPALLVIPKDEFAKKTDETAIKRDESAVRTDESAAEMDEPAAEMGVSTLRSKAEDFLAMPTYTMESAGSALNRGMDSINVMYVWSDGDLLRVISITSFNVVTRQAAIVVIPLDTVINAGETVTPQDKLLTIQDIYREQGREGVRDLLQEKLEIQIPNYVHVNQTALQKLSDIVGALEVNGGETTMLQAFEETAAGIRTDDRDVVRAVASQILRPRMLLEVPKLLWIFTHDITTNFSTEQMVRVFHLSRQMDLGNMRKTALPGYEYFNNGLRYLLVSEQTWKNIIYEITN